MKLVDDATVARGGRVNIGLAAELLGAFMRQDGSIEAEAGGMFVAKALLSLMGGHK